MMMAKNLVLSKERSDLDLGFWKVSHSWYECFCCRERLAILNFESDSTIPNSLRVGTSRARNIKRVTFGSQSYSTSKLSLTWVTNQSCLHIGAPVKTEYQTWVSHFGCQYSCVLLHITMEIGTHFDSMGRGWPMSHVEVSWTLHCAVSWTAESDQSWYFLGGTILVKKVWVPGVTVPGS